jgi:hypothetical protein
MNFNQTIRPTPFSFYDANGVFQNDADKMITFILRKHGEDILSVELTKKMIWACFEEATFTFNAAIVEYQTKSNLASLLGFNTGSVDPTDDNTANLSINLTNTYVQPNLEFLSRQAEPYASIVGFGQSENTYSGSIQMVLGQQDYNLYTDLKDNTGIPLFDYMPSGSQGRMKVVEVFHDAPIQYLFNSNIATNFMASGLPVESFIPDTRFYILPLFEDVLRGAMLKEAQKTRRSHYRYKISGQNIRFYPIPRNFIDGIAQKVWIRIRFPGSPAPGIIDTGLSGSTLPDDSLYGISNPANVPFGLIEYNSLNPWAKNWIFQYTMALCTELLGRTRGKFTNIPIGNADLQLNGETLQTQGREDKQNLLYGDGGLFTKLDSLKYSKLAEEEALKAENLQKQLATLPVPPTHAISIK